MMLEAVAGKKRERSMHHRSWRKNLNRDQIFYSFLLNKLIGLFDPDRQIKFGDCKQRFPGSLKYEVVFSFDLDQPRRLKLEEAAHNLSLQQEGGILQWSDHN